MLRRRSVRFVPPLVILVSAASLGGCQACVADSSQPDPGQTQGQAARPSGTEPIRLRPHLMRPGSHFVLRTDAGSSDE